MGTGKQSALKQSSDGSFELVVQDVTEPVAPKAPVKKASTPRPEPEPARSGGKLKWIVVAAVVFALGFGGAIAAFSFFESDGDGTEEGEALVDETPPEGFKPYTGGEADEDPVFKPVKVVKPSRASRRVAEPTDDVEEEMVESDIDEVVEDNSWDVDESGVEEIVESEEVPPDFEDEVAQTEEIEPGRDGRPFVKPKTLKNIRRRINQDFDIRKTLPNVNLKAAPRMRTVNPGNAIGPQTEDEILVIEGDNVEEELNQEE